MRWRKGSKRAEKQNQKRRESEWVHRKAILWVALVVIIILLMALLLPVIPVTEVQEYQYDEEYERELRFQVVGQLECLRRISGDEGAVVEVPITVRNNDTKPGTYRVVLKVVEAGQGLRTTTLRQEVSPGQSYRFSHIFNWSLGQSNCFEEIHPPKVLDTRLVTKTETVTVWKSLLDILTSS
ncbi:MAG: hypothetical protein KAW84_06220 [Thermoplasmata archaeon]|nr:hypothetical protein [Thermoplasmata archaeon]